MSVVRYSPRTHFGTPVHVGQLHVDNSTAYSKITVSNNGSVINAPGLRYRETASIWEYSNDGLIWYAIGTGSGSAGDGTIPLGTPTDGTYTDGYFPFQITTQINDAIDNINELLITLSVSGSAADSYKVTEFLTSAIPTETNHVLPSSQTYIMGSGSYMDVYFNGQLLNHGNSHNYDYMEINNSTVKFYFEVPTASFLTYVIKRLPVKETEYITTTIPQDTNHTLPSVVSAARDFGVLNVYFNGQMLHKDVGAIERDYKEVDNATIKFHFEVPAGTTFTYVV